MCLLRGPEDSADPAHRSIFFLLNEIGRRKTMRISFDVDDTLVCGPDVPTEQVVPWWGRPWFPERLRRGSRALMRDLLQRGCELWIYTTSYRGSFYLRNWFWSMGVTITDVVNQDRHERVVGRRGPSKYPPAFSIDLHIDDSVGVGMEGQEHRFSVLVVSPDDLEWTSRVLQAVEARMGPGKR
jgi:hypothetical protein